MPSSHAANSFGQALFWGMVFKPWRWALFILALLISLSRVFVGVHYPADITVGALLGALLGLAAYVTPSKTLHRTGAGNQL
jgi:undecaprenyl-diphosphatase